MDNPAAAFSTESRNRAADDFSTIAHLKNATEQARLRNYHEFLIVDVDSHHYEAEHLGEILQFVDDPTLRQIAQGKASIGRSGLWPTQLGFQDMGGRITRYNKRRTEKTPPGHHRDASLAKYWMDAIGVDIACLFPTAMLQLGLHPQVEMEVHLARGYNRWLVEKVLANEPRLCSMLYLPLNSPDDALEMIEEFGDKKGVIGFMVTSDRGRPVFDNEYIKVYAALEERGLPLAFHAGYNWTDKSLSQLNRFISVHALGFTIFNMIHLTNWIINGLPERFPKLKVIWIESGLAWVPFLMQRLDNEYMMRTSEAPLLKRKPSDYMREMYFSNQPMESVGNIGMLEETFKMINAETQLLYASDYPHWDMDLPSRIYDLPFLDAQAKRNILGENARKLFNLEPVFADWKIDARRKASGGRDGSSI
jgi:predicted TIM-barrel fold metal-dependent hydrolase